MLITGPIEILVGLSILTRWTRLGAYVLSAWLLAISINLVFTGGFYDLAVRDVEIAIAAYVLANLLRSGNRLGAHQIPEPDRCGSPHARWRQLRRCVWPAHIQRTLETAEASESIATAEGEGMVRHTTGRARGNRAVGLQGLACARLTRGLPGGRFRARRTTRASRCPTEMQQQWKVETFGSTSEVHLRR
jgi:ABC-type branched-subunit amino acid transport system permease subunit